MSLFLLTQLALVGLVALPASSVVFSYRTRDGVEHFVSEREQIPGPYKAIARRVDLSGVSLNPSLANGLRPLPVVKGGTSDPERKAKEALRAIAAARSKDAAPLPLALLATVLLCLSPALLLGWLREPARRLRLWLALVDLAFGLALGLLALRPLSAPSRALARATARVFRSTTLRPP